MSQTQQQKEKIQDQQNLKGNIQNRKKKLEKIDKQTEEKLQIPIYSPRTTYKKIRENDDLLLKELMLKLEPFTVSVIANDFEAAGGEVRVAEFIILMKEHLKELQPGIPNREYKLMRTLAYLFEQIDLNQNELLDWEELANYVLGKATVIDNIKMKNQVVKYYSKNPDYSIHQKFMNSLQKILYIDHLDRLAFFQKGTDTIMIVGTDSQTLNLQTGQDGMLQQRQLKIQPQDITVDMFNIKKEKEGNIIIEKKETYIERSTIIIDMIYISDYNLLMVSSNDRFIRGYRYVSNGFVQATFPKSDQKIEKEIKKTEVSCMSWDEIKKKLYCGLDNGNILVWSLGQEIDDLQTTELIKKDQIQKDKQYINSQKEYYLDKGAHTLVVQAILPMAKLQYVASAGLDGVIILWDTITNTKKREYREHNRGIMSLAFNPQTILLFSAGFDHWIGVFNPYTDHIIYKITGHNCAILQIKVIQEYQQLISLDQEGNVKVRDINKFNINQSFSLESHEDKHRFEGQDFCFVTNPLKLFFVGYNIQQYQYDINYNPTLTDENVALTCLVVSKQLNMYTPTGNRVKVWSMLSGELLKIFTGLTHQNADISSFILDSLKKRMLIGDTDGYISIFNAENGAKIKNLPRHQTDVVHIIECLEARLFVTASIDNQIHLTLDNDFGENELLRVISIKEQHISKITYFSENKLLLVATALGQIAFFESDTGKLHGSSQASRYNESITSINMVPNIPFLISTTSTGKVNFIACPPLLYKYSIVESFINFDQEDTGEPLGILNACLSENTEQIFITDEKYYLKSYDISQIIDNIKDNIKEFFTLKKQEQNQYLSQLKNFNSLQKNEPFEPIWVIKAHNESINSISFAENEKLVMTCSTDKKVKIWNSETGQFLAHLQQNLNCDKPTPLAYRKKFTEELYDPEEGLFEKRIDKGYQEHEDSQNQSTSFVSELDEQKKGNILNQGNIKRGSIFDDDKLRKKGNKKQSFITQQDVNQNNSSQEQKSKVASDASQIKELEEEYELGEDKGNKSLEDKNISQNINSKTLSSNNNKSVQESKSKQSQNQDILDKNIDISKITDKQLQYDEDEDIDIEEEEIEESDDQIENINEDISIQAEFDPYYYHDKIDFTKVPQNKLSNSEWKLFLDFKPILEEQEQNLNNLENLISSIEKQNQMLKFPDKKFNIVNFEVNPKLFDPNNQFKPYIQTKNEKDPITNFVEGGTSKEAIANKVKKQQQKEKGKDLRQINQVDKKKIKINEETWNSLYKNKKNVRNIDPTKFKEKIQHSKKISDITKEKVNILLQKLENYENVSNNQIQPVKKNQTPTENEKKNSIYLQEDGENSQSVTYGPLSNQQKIKQLIQEAFTETNKKDVDPLSLYNKLNKNNSQQSEELNQVKKYKKKKKL